MGLRKVHIYEPPNGIIPNTVTYHDLSTQFFCREEHVGKMSRGEASLSQLQALNPNCDISILPSHQQENQQQQQTDELYNLIPKYEVVVFTDYLLKDLIPYNQFCRRHNVKFIACETRGVFGSIFNDFGPEFLVNDINGENPQSSLIINLTTNEKGEGIIDFHNQDNEKPLKLYTGDKIKIFNVEGLEGLNGQVREIERTEMWKLNIGPISDLDGCYTGGGYFEEVKQSKTIAFKSLEEHFASGALNNFTEYDSGKMDYPHQLQVAFESLHAFVQKWRSSDGMDGGDDNVHLPNINHLPQSYNQQDAQEMLQMAKQIAEQKMVTLSKDADDIVKKLSYTARGQLNPVVTFLGGIVGQEVQKAITGKFHPLHQCMHWECMDVLPDPLPSAEDCAPQESRYDSQIAVFGRKFQKKIGNLRYFMVGAGALGCEFLKNFALQGVGCGPRGKITVTDMDTIEVSNLSRQFLFNEHHVGEMKSTCACEAAKKMNPNLNCVALLDRVGPETEDTFDEAFWNSLSGVVTALDNVAARRYVDEKCVLHRLPMIDSGTLGPNSHVQVVSPHARTECYRSKKEPETVEFAFCTVHFHPNIIEHTITWAKNYFAGVFETGVQEVNSFLKDPQAYLDSPDKGHNVMSLETVYNYLVSERPQNYADCIKWARQQYENLFHYGIRNVLITYPPDRKTSTGAAFWSGAKRCPKPVQFDLNDEMSQMFIDAASRIYASLYGIEGEGDAMEEEDNDTNKVINVSATTPQKRLLSALKGFQPHPFVPNPVRDETPQDEITPEEQEKKRQQEREAHERHTKHLTFLRTKLSNYQQFENTKPLPVIEFEKDDDSNHHVEFITAASNLRARAYRIPEADTHTTKGIAGNIIPAMITTTALTTGLVCTELYKVIQDKDRKYLRDAFIKLGLPSFQQWIPKKAGVEFAGRFTLWDQFVIDEGKDIPLDEVINRLRKQYQIEALGLTYYGNVVWSVMTDAKTKAAREKAPLAKMIQMLQQKKFPSSQASLILNVTGQECGGGEEIFDQLPPLVYRFRQSKKDQSAKARAALAKKKMLAAKRKRA